MPGKKRPKKKKPVVPTGLNAFALDSEDKAFLAAHLAHLEGELAKLAEQQSAKQLVSTNCPKCKLRLVQPEVESHRCILCGCTELNKKAWDGHDQGVLPPA